MDLRVIYNFWKLFHVVNIYRLLYFNIIEYIFDLLKGEQKLKNRHEYKFYEYFLRGFFIFNISRNRKGSHIYKK